MSNNLETKEALTLGADGRIAYDKLGMFGIDSIRLLREKGRAALPGMPREQVVAAVTRLFDILGGVISDAEIQYHFGGSSADVPHMDYHEIMDFYAGMREMLTVMTKCLSDWTHINKRLERYEAERCARAAGNKRRRGAPAPEGAPAESKRAKDGDE